MNTTAALLAGMALAVCVMFLTAVGWAAWTWMDGKK